MKTDTQRKREALYSGIADMPPLSVEDAMRRFNHGYAQKPHTAVMHLLHDLHRLRKTPERRALPGMLPFIPDPDIEQG